MKRITSILFLLLPGVLLAQTFKKGLIMPNNDFEICCMFLPVNGLNIFDKPNGNLAGKIIPGSLDNYEEFYHAFLKTKAGKTELEYSSLYMVGYEVMALVYEDVKDGFAKIATGHWIKIEELHDNNLEIIPWIEYLINNKNVLGWYANDPGLHLRKEPDKNSEKIALLKGDLWQIIPSNETKGLWCKVQVKKYRRHPCSGEENLVIETFTGWIKILSDEQTPNVWKYSKGC